MSVANARERARFEALCMPFRADVFRFVYWLCRDRSLAEDVVQETLLRAWRSLDSLSDETAAKPWLLTIARRELARVFERKRFPTVDIDAANEAQHEALAVNDGHEVEEMRRAILRLEVIHREPLVLQVLLGYSTEEIAKHLEISVPAVLTRLFRARQVLRQQLTGGCAPEGKRNPEGIPRETGGAPDGKRSPEGIPRETGGAPEGKRNPEGIPREVGAKEDSRP